MGVLDLGRRPDAAHAALAVAARGAPRGLGVRVHAGALPDPDRLPEAVELVVLPAGVDPAPWRSRRVFVQVTSAAEAALAADAGADALIAVGSESGGRIGDDSAFVLLQRLARETRLPIWVQGGIGPQTAAACFTAGAAGVVLDSQLACVRESTLPGPVRDALRAMDGTETTVVGGHRLLILGRRSRSGTASLAAELRDAPPDEIAERLGGDDPGRQLLPAGQDAAFARPLAERYATAGGIVAAIRRATREAVGQARALTPLAPDAPLARAHGIRYPILQGPMTRVSDRAAFAAAVAAAGGLPFLALSLLRDEPLRALLAETADLLGDRPWGVGILGFVPAALRAQQLAVIDEVRPPFALIAGGRPSQARRLEKHGIATYLHVPSGGLLDLFLREGARRFVFEGRECGGHVGPLSSFVLWQTQIDRLLAFDRPEELAVVFAGGIQDARSAAMVAAMAAPLAARGIKVGVLMGTAYLFTKEVVETGAVVSAYQQMAIECRATSLLETGPGHSTRCVDTEYARAFRAERERLEGTGLDSRELWARLETLNLGRLRIASKGLRREGEQLLATDEATQRREGMYMIGQAATLRDSVCTIEELHREIGEGSVRRLEGIALPVDLEVPVDGGGSSRPVDVAIVGMAAIFPQARDLDEYWANIVEGVDAITEVSRERWDPDVYYDPEGPPGKTTPSKWGGFIDDVVFDPARYGIPPRSLGSIDPIQLLSLEVARRALEDAAYESRAFDRDRTAVIFGAEGGTDLSKAYGFRAMYPQVAGRLPEALDAHLPVPTEDSFPGVLTNVISGRIANRLDLGGENYTVNAACASSLAALSVAAQWLSAGSSDMVVVGGADVHNSIGDFLMFSSVHALSPSGRCRTFDSAADGITLGEGVGAVVVKRLADAERDGDRIYAVVKGIAGSSDGKSLGLTAPRLEGQQKALRWAYRAAGVSPAEVGLMEAHGTGTVVGDRTELQSMESVFGEAGAQPGTCVLSSVKSQIGHTKAAAGIASLIKAALCLHHRVLPPTLHVEKPNPRYDAATSPFTLSDRSRPWVAERRLAAVSAFGFGGTNYHAVLEGYDGTAVADGMAGAALSRAVWPAELFLFRGADPDAALRRVELLGRALAAEPAHELRDLARSASCGGEGPVQVAFVARDRDDLGEKLARAPAALRAAGLEDDRSAPRGAEAVEPEEARLFVRGGRASGKVAFLFAGQGSQYVGMLADLFVAFPALGDILAAAPPVADRMFPPRAFTPAERATQDAALTATEVAQVAIGMCDMALARVMAWLGIRPDMLGGHSYGEMAALSAAEAWDTAELLRLSSARARAILEAAGDDPGAMAAVQAGASEIAPVVSGLDRVALANHNAPRQTILSGPTAAIEAAIERLTAAGIKATRLNVACAFHSEVVATARHAFAEALATADVRPLQRLVWSNATAQPYPPEPDSVRALLAEQLARPVLFAQQIEAMYEAGARIFVEIGPGRVLTGLVDRTLDGRPHEAIATDVRGEPGLVRLQLALARLAAAGVELDVEAVFAGRGAVGFDLEAPPERSLSATAWIVNGHYARPARGPLPPGAYRPPTGTLVPATAPAATITAPGGPREQAVIEYLRNVREQAEAQRQVMLSYLGAPVGSPVAGLPELAAGASETSRPTAPPPVGGAEAPALGEAAAPPRERPLGEVLLEIVGERTGYPVEMLDLDLDLEADLSIDSIKRIEILGALNEAIGLADRLGDNRDELVEELSAIKTLRGIQAWIEERATAPSVTESIASALPADEGAAPAVTLSRYRFELRTLAPAARNGADLAGRTFVLTDDGQGVAAALQERLQAEGAEVRIARDGDALDGADGLVHLAPLSPAAGPGDVKALYRLSRQIVAGGGRTIIGVTGMGGGFGHDADPLRVYPGESRAGQGGVAGFLKSLAKEWSEGRVRVVDLNPQEDASALADHVWQELVADDDRIEVGYAGDERRGLAVVPAPPAAPGEGAALLDGESVVLVTGGARGITAQVSIALARRFQCRLELVGRSPLPADVESTETAGIEDPLALKGRLIEIHPSARPAEIEERWRALRAEREIRETLEAVRAAGARVRYHAVDVRSGPAFGGLIDELYANDGRLDGVVHGAGTIEDKLLVHKTPESFDRVFDTKVAGALTLARKLRGDARFVVFFSSTAGAFGNRGQTDYAAANDVLDKLALHLNARLPARVVSVDWGPWDSAGMVSPELRREYGRRGIGLIPLGAGVASLLDEIACDDGDVAQVVLTCGAPPE